MELFPSSSNNCRRLSPIPSRFPGTAPGCRTYAAEYRLVDGIPRLDIFNHIDKARIRAKGAVHLAFPFRRRTSSGPSGNFIWKRRSGEG